MTIQDATDITGDNAKHALGTAGQRARRIFITSLTGTSRFGDASVGSARGVACPASVPQVFSASDADPTDSIDLSTAYVYVPSGSTLTYTWST